MKNKEVVVEKKVDDQSLSTDKPKLVSYCNNEWKVIRTSKGNDKNVHHYIESWL